MILSEAMRDARDELTRKLALSPRRWAWGRLHQLDLENQSLGRAGLGLARAVFNRGPFEVGGGGASVDATSWDATQGYDVTSAPSMRMVVDLGDLDRSRWVNLTGASGHVASAHYRDQTPLWVQGDTLAWAFGRTAVQQGVAGPARAGAGALEPGDPELGGDGGRPGGRGRRRGTASRTSSELSSTQTKVPTGTRAEGAVVGAAAAAQPVAVAADGEAGDEDDVGGGDGVGAERAAGRFEQTPAGGAQVGRPVVRRPVEVVVGLQQRQDHPLAGGLQPLEQGTGAGLAGDRDVDRHGGRPAYLRGLQQVAPPGPGRARRGRSAGGAGGPPGAGRAGRAWWPL